MKQIEKFFINLDQVIKNLILLIAVLFAIFSGYMIYWRLSFCSLMAEINIKIPPQDINSYISRRIAFNKICNDPFDYFTPVISFGFLGYILYLLYKREK